MNSEMSPTNEASKVKTKMVHLGMGRFMEVPIAPEAEASGGIAKTREADSNKDDEVVSQADYDSFDEDISSADSEDCNPTLGDQPIKSTGLFGTDTFSSICRRTQEKSKYGHLPNYGIISVIVKSPDSLTQE